MFLSTIAGLVMWASQMTLAAQGCPTSDGINETYGPGDDGGTFIGAVCAEGERSAGLFIAPDGSITIEVD
jgi:hypothetical protein